MNIKVFSFNKPYFSFWNVPTDKIEPEIESWLLRNPKVKIFEIKHDLAQGIWFAPQLIVTIYYSQADDKSWLAEPNARANGPEQPSLTLAINGIHTLWIWNPCLLRTEELEDGDTAAYRGVFLSV